MSIEQHMGVFLPFTKKMGKQMQRSIMVAFMDNGIHFSPSGTTARLVINHCLENGYPFSVSWELERGYIVRLARV